MVLIRCILCTFLACWVHSFTLHFNNKPCILLVFVMNFGTFHSYIFISFQVVLEVGGDLEWWKGPEADFQNFRSGIEKTEFSLHNASHGSLSLGFKVHAGRVTLDTDHVNPTQFHTGSCQMYFHHFLATNFGDGSKSNVLWSHMGSCQYSHIWHNVMSNV